MGAISQTAQEALQRAQEAGKLAQGKFLYETTLTDDKVHFGFNKTKLSPDVPKRPSMTSPSRSRTRNKPVYIEVQGHTTDNVGSDKYNESLGLSRAPGRLHRYLKSRSRASRCTA